MSALARAQGGEGGYKGAPQNFAGDGYVYSLDRAAGSRGVYKAKLLKLHVLTICHLLCQLPQQRCFKKNISTYFNTLPHIIDEKIEA